MKYNPQKIEKKWQEKWREEKIYSPNLKKAKNPFYNLMMFPYPSGEGLHVGHVYAFSGADTFGRFKRQQGKDVFEPMGFDAFGIHSENYALKVDKHPKELIKETTAHYKEQLKKAGLGLDWSHEVKTTDPSYYKWTQWLFLQLYKNGLAERKEAAVNWCPSCKTVLADEQVIKGKCERCDTEVIQKKLKQWFLKITDYADRLDWNLDKIDWPEKIKKLQKNWIGKSEGARIKFKVNEINETIEVFTTRPDTLFGATFMVISPEHFLASDHLSEMPNKNKVEGYIKESQKRTRQERAEKEKKGVDTGLKGMNPATGEKIPIWVGDFVLAHYGGGAVMSVPAHDQRDFDFAKKYNLPLRQVIQPKGSSSEDLKEAYEDEGVLKNSGQFNGMNSEKARERITQWLQKKGLAEKDVSYKLRDWLISRQRYWGPPIPIIYCKKCGEVPVPEKDLPVLLPYMKDFQPTGTEETPLAHNNDFIKTKCPKCGSEAERETHVSDNFLDSAWYFFRYPSSDYNNRAFDKKLTKKWLPVDMYIGGAEHSVLHLMYTRFITMALFDMGYIDFEEPFKKFRAHGLITKDGAKMSKSKGNVINPDEYIDKVGADCFRMYLLFLGPFGQGGGFSDEGISGIERFLTRIWKISLEAEEMKEKNSDIEKKLHQTIKKVTEDMENLKFNTSIAALMEYLNKIEESKIYNLKYIKSLILLLTPLAPHICEEIWREVWEEEGSVLKQNWPEYNIELIREEKITLIIQVNGKVRDQIKTNRDISKEEAEKKARKQEKIKKYLKGKEVKKTVFVPKKLINFVVK